MHYGFEYTRLEDLARVTTDELTKDEVLERIYNMLASVLVIPYHYLEHDHQNQPAAVSILTL